MMGKIREIVLILTLLVSIIFISIISIDAVLAQEICEYNGIKTEFDYPYQAPGAKIEYRDQKFIRMVDPKAIKFLDHLKGLTCLELADFYNQGISGDLKDLKDLVNLKVMSLHTNPGVYGDICAFSKAVKLKSLKLAFDEKVYGNISCLKDLNLETFAMTYAKISGNLADLSHMTNLKALYLTGTNISGNISALSKLTNLEELTLADSESDGSRFYGDLASLDSLKNLRRAALYNMNAVNCKRFHEVHPAIEGGCSAESSFTVKNTNVESERLIGKESKMKGKPEPPKECTKDGVFIGENECRALTGKKTVKGFLQKVAGWLSSLFK